MPSSLLRNKLMTNKASLGLIPRSSAAGSFMEDGEALEKIACYVPSLSMDELKELEAEVMQLA